MSEWLLDDVDGWMLDADGCVWRRNLDVPGAWQIWVECTKSWSDADLFPDEDGPYEQLNDFEDRPRVMVCGGTCRDADHH